MSETQNDAQHAQLAALQAYLLHAEERAILRAMPRQIADVLKLEPRPALELLVEAMFRGDVILHWELACPACAFHAEEPDWLRYAQHDYTCPACGANYDVHLDDEAQVTFSPHPTLRAISPDSEDPEFQREMRQRFPPTTVHELMTVQAFRDWARNEPLASGEYLEIRRMTVWFSDLTGSTALYARNGDPFAYGLVREHFDLVFKTINRCQGAVVKTMGDGIMAVFTSNARALEAALAAHQTLDDFNRQRGLSNARRLMLKIGIHAGPSIVVTLNERLDYFGTTVNVAARVSDLAQGTQTVFTEPVQADPEVQAIAADYNVEPFRSSIRGLGQAMLVYRLAQAETVTGKRTGWRSWLRRS